MPRKQATKAGNPLFRASAVEVLMEYPIGYAILWYVPIAEPPVPSPPKQRLMLAMTSDEARKIGHEFLRLAQTIDAEGGTKQ